MADEIDSMKARVEKYARKRWEGRTVRACIPEGEQPIATRYDPTVNALQVACLSGKRYTIAVGDLHAAEVRQQSGETHGAYERDGEGEAKQLHERQMREAIQAWERYAARQRELEKYDTQGEGEGEEQDDDEDDDDDDYGDDDDEPKEEYYDYENDRELENDTKRESEEDEQARRKLGSFEDQWEIAEARADEYALATNQKADLMVCHCRSEWPCTADHENDYTEHKSFPRRQPMVSLRFPRHNGHVNFIMCAECARSIVIKRPDYLDIDKEG